MPVSTRWHDLSILIFEISGRWTWEEFFQAYDEVLPAVQQAGHTIYALVVRLPDEHLHYIPPNAIVHSINLMRRMPPNVGMGIIVDSESRFLRAIHAGITRMYPPYSRKVAVVATLEDALATIQRVRA